MLIKDKDITSYQLLLIKQDRVLVLASLTSFFDYTVMYRSIEASTSPPPPRAYPGHLTPLPYRGGGNLIIRVFRGVGNLIPML